MRQPSAHLDGTRRKRRGEDARPPGNRAAQGRFVGEHENDPRSRRTPSEPRGRGCPYDARLAIEGRKHLLQVDEPGLGLDYEQGTGRRMPGEDVYRTSLTVHVERVLDHRLPAEVGQLPRDQVDDPRVAFVQQGGELGPAPMSLQADGDLESRRNTTNRGESHLGKMPSFDPGNRLLTDAGGIGKVQLPPPSPSSDCSND